MLPTLNERRQILGKLQELTNYWRHEENLPYLVAALNRTAMVQLKLYDPAAALKVVEDSLTTARMSGDAKLISDALNTAAEVYIYRQEIQAALSALTHAYEISLKADYRRGQAQSLTGLCAAYFQEADLDQASANGEAALVLWQELKDKRGEARTLYHLGEAYLRPNPQKATATLKDALTIWQELGDKDEQASTLIDLNFIAARQGEWQKSLAFVEEAQSLLLDENAEPFLAGQIASSFGTIYTIYGQPETSLHYYEKALTLYRDKAHSVEAEMNSARIVGLTHSLMGNYSQAIQQIEYSLELAQRHHSPFHTALCHEDIGRTYLAVGQYTQAKQNLIAAIAYYQRNQSRREIARAQTFLGQLYYAQGEYSLTQKAYQQALQIYRQSYDYTNEAALSYGMGKLRLKQGNLAEAGEYLEQSIRFTEQLRDNATSQDLRSSFLASVHDRYETYIDWLMQRHVAEPNSQFNVAAFEASEQGRARSLLESLQAQQSDITEGKDAELLAEEKALQQQLQTAQTELFGSGNTTEAQKAFIEIKARYEAVQAQIRETTPAYAQLMRPQAVKLHEIQQQILDDDTLLLEYALGDSKSYLWAVTRTGFASYTLPDRLTIETVAHKLYDQLSATSQPASDIGATTLQLSQILLNPITGQSNYKRLIIVADGVLQYVPFQALAWSNIPNEPLVIRHEIINTPSASTLASVRQKTARRAPSDKLVAAFGDPVFPSGYAQRQDATMSGEQVAMLQSFEGERLQHALRGLESDKFDSQKLPELFYAKREIANLRALVPDTNAMIATDFDATRENLQKTDLRRYRILHLATHGILNSTQPEFSGIVLSLVDREGKPINGFVTLSDIYNLRAPVDLVVLSACRTALGKDVRGEGLIGLTRGFMYAGAASVVASLWKVDDAATAELMKRFYANLLQANMPPGEALRAAQNSLRQEPQWQSPYYWAAFTIQGEYRQPIMVPTAKINPTYSKVAGSVLLLGLIAAGGWWYRYHKPKTR